MTSMQHVDEQKLIAIAMDAHESNHTSINVASASMILRSGEGR